jgi:glycosyltransferase involved in cell wall biosynthesis
VHDWELIIIDDGSKDDSNEIIASYTDPRITHLTQENRGAHNTINRALAMTRGDILAILNSDDEFHPNRFERCLAVLQADPATMFVSTWIDIVDPDSKILGTKMAWHNMEPWPVRNKHLSMAALDDYALNALMSNFVSTTSNMVFRRELYEAIGGMRNLRFAHDWDFLLRACAEHKCVNIDEALLSYRVHNSNTISSNRKAMLFEVCWMFAANMDRFLARLLPDLARETLQSNHLRLLESINLQGNDHIFWLLYWHIGNLRGQGIQNPEEIYLQDADLRASIIEYIKEDSDQPG